MGGGKLNEEKNIKKTKRTLIRVIGLKRVLQRLSRGCKRH